MPVFRVERNKGYTVMSNYHLRDKSLSLKAKGLLSQILSLPEDWDYTLSGLCYINRESNEDALRGLLTAARQGRQKNRAATFKIKIGRKPSIRKQLAEAKSAAAPKKAPAKTKNQELEVG